jgi:hypothetical protein
LAGQNGNVISNAEMNKQVKQSIVIAMTVYMMAMAITVLNTTNALGDFVSDCKPKYTEHVITLDVVQIPKQYFDTESGENRKCPLLEFYEQEYLKAGWIISDEGKMSIWLETPTTK